MNTFSWSASIAVFLFICCAPLHATRWLLVDFGKDSASTTFGTEYPTWNQLLAPAGAQYADPDGDTAHWGISTRSFAGVKGATPITFKRGHKVVATFYNTSGSSVSAGPRISFTDQDSCSQTETFDTPWYGMYWEQNGYTGRSIPGHQTGEIHFNIADSAWLLAYLQVPSVGDHYCVAIARWNVALVLTKIELTDEVDSIAPEAPANLQAAMISLSQGSGNCGIQLTWDEAIDLPGGDAYTAGISRYFIYRNGEFYACLNGYWLNYWRKYPPLRYRDMSVAPNTHYTYEVTGVDRAVNGMYVTHYSTSRMGNESPAAMVEITTPSFSTGNLINPYDEIAYQGAFKLPSGGTNYRSWNYAYEGLAYFPDGNPGYDDALELPGSLYGIGHPYSMNVSEVNIPLPVVSSTLSLLPRATALKPFTDALGLIFGAGVIHANSFTGMEYHPGHDAIGEGIYVGSCGTDYSPPSSFAGHGAFNLDMTQGYGPWYIGAMPGDSGKISPALSSKVIFPAPQDWADSMTNGRSLILGRTRVSGVGEPCAGPNLYAVAPWESGSLAADSTALLATRMLSYAPMPDTGMRWIVNFNMITGFSGGAWLSSNGKSAIAIVGKRSIGEDWYGTDGGILQSGAWGNDLDWPRTQCGPCGSKGPHSTGEKKCMYLYNPEDLNKVINGQMQPWDPQPYMIWDITDRLYRNQGGDIAFDRERGYLYAIEENGEGVNGPSLVHVWKVASETTAADKTRETALAEAVMQVFPNPFNPSMAIKIAHRDPGAVNAEVKIYNVHGKLVQKLKATGHQLATGITWDASNLPSGTYILRAELGGNVYTKQAVLLQ
ncbi:MAG: hypothetical protein A2268_11395 [Candidatus Raymondbacteria bacterium RifOxyA12_full_50_37]|uniref:Secretion system C-terminal sorting domain-containing protein n=1 Tax=Candidatus Raymondbacteria bacterium RIFOXYD12_FULL_49_13 TaxID=1817890 RepID=A0A1F7FAT6_UNCRA|nr:MAG: hypothetical protein A2268_11395 [Candidatus Raymondbacteria bacterium RifOxyA12_full_50_37]OGJ92373.1 MAG: hypothetical protein A2248_10520 [Candidatus Raymondbacteria bacterium RIFOXYA2_FULL_49_16]OGJ99354.1 MAG: hypothetical protein A2453_13580 [Candidatus Raymondbacteria bacterium RIFOXYC2_FULL_50_21]OGK02675.1 MAG: hypothetical protein A2487_00950 [Candidatus Raymondbacteria bacterium RifOxyC12_full_50_8]OGK03632.1 MAG: hypothetical protein A2519_02540 [Candidatus Raymondbacteria b